MSEESNLTEMTPIDQYVDINHILVELNSLEKELLLDKTDKRKVINTIFNIKYELIDLKAYKNVKTVDGDKLQLRNMKYEY